MGLIYRKSKKIAPGVKANFSLSGLSSISFGGKGSRITFGSKRTTTSFHIPGTSLRYQTSSSSKNKQYPTSNSNSSNWGCALWLLSIFLFAGFLMGGNPNWAIGSVVVIEGLYYTIKYLKNKFNKHDKQL